MGKLNLKKHSAFLYAFLAVITAVVLRQIGFRADESLDWFCNFLRSAIYVGLFSLCLPFLRMRSYGETITATQWYIILR